MITEKIRGTFALVFVCVGVNATCAQTTYYVDGTCGNDSWTGTARVCAAPDGPKRTIQAGLDAAAGGDIVVVGDGLYTGAPAFDIQPGNDVTLRSENGAANCRIEGILPGSIVGRVGVGVTAQTSIQGFTFANSGGVQVNGDAGISDCVFVENLRFGGLLIDGSFPAGPMASPRISNCRFESNSATRSAGGAVSGSYCNAIFEDCVFTGNEVTEANGGAVSIANQSSPRFIRCTFTANAARIVVGSRGDGYGGAIYSDFSTLSLEDCAFERNTADAKGGAVFCQRGPGIYVSGCRFEGNTAVEFGGAIAARDGDRTIDSSVFTGNLSGLAGPGRGGAVWMDGVGLVSIVDTGFVRNEVGLAGSSEIARGGAVLIDGNTTPATLSIERSRFVENRSLGQAGAGGAIYARGARLVDCDIIANASGDLGAPFGGNAVDLVFGGIEMVRCQVVGNTRGGMYTTGDSISISDSAFVHNDLWGLVASADVSGRIANCLIAENGDSAFQWWPVRITSNIDVNNCTIVNNDSGHSATVFLSGTVANSVVWGNSPAAVEGGGTFSYSCIEAGATGPGVISRDPRFVDPATGNYRLGSVSPCVDAADNGAVPPGVVLDLDGNPRFVDDPGMPNSGLGSSPIVDMGAFERHESSCYPDCDQSTGLGTLDLFDFLCFQNSFVTANPYACNCDTTTGPDVCDIFDFLCFQNAFVAGCP